LVLQTKKKKMKRVLHSVITISIGL
jgi:hypothetical protein